MIQDQRMLSTAKLVAAPEWQSRLHARQLDRFDALWNLTGDIIKHSNSTEVLRATIEGRPVFVKKYWVTNLNQSLSAITRGALFGKSKVQREFENMQQLRAWGLDAPAPVAWGEQRRAGWLLRSLLVSEGILDPVPLDRLIVETITPHLNPLPQGERKRTAPLSFPKGEGQGEGFARSELIDKLADYVRRLHEHRFVHHDLFWRNIILSGHAPDRFHLIDAHKGRIWRDELAGRSQDLAALDAPAPFFFRRTERLRFLLRYRGHARLTDDDRRLAQRVLALAEPQRANQLARVREARR
jgi:hypothetical protein